MKDLLERTSLETSEFITKDELLKIVEGVVSVQVAAAVESFVRKNTERAKELSVIERVIKVEEELKSLRETELARFEAINTRFEALHREMDKRFEALHREMDKRFEAMDARIEALHREMDKRFEAMDARFEAIDARFEAIDARFEAMDKRFSFMQWFMLTGFTLVSVLVAIFGLYNK